MISAHTLSAIKAATDLQALAAEYVVVKKSGAQYLCLCPFHNDREPSCRIYREHYYCFSCQAAGSAVDWVMHYEKIRFSDAIRFLADRAGISLDEKPLTRKALAYAVDEAQFCAWWWQRQTDIVATSVQDALSEDDEEWLGCLERITGWMRALPAAEKFSVFRERRTEAERKQWREELACEETLKDWLFGLFDSHWRAGLGGRTCGRQEAC